MSSDFNLVNIKTAVFVKVRDHQEHKVGKSVDSAVFDDERTHSNIEEQGQSITYDSPYTQVHQKLLMFELGLSSVNR